MLEYLAQIKETAKVKQAQTETEPLKTVFLCKI